MKIFKIRRPIRINRFSPRNSDVNPAWWLSPVGLLLGFLMPLLFYVNTVGGSNNPDLIVRGANFLTTKYLCIGVLIIGAMAIAAWVGSQIRPAHPADLDGYEVRRIALIVGWLLCIVYLFAFRTVLFVPSNWLQVLHGWRPGRAEASRIAGVTSLTNIAPAFFSLICFLKFFQKRAIGRHLGLISLLVFGCTLFRSYFWSERLALIEIAVATSVIWLTSPDGGNGRLKTLIRRGGPYLALPLVIFYFAIGEYFRSWQSSFYNNGSREFWSYVIGRFATYYYTALNNGAGILSTVDWPTYDLTVILEWLHKFPLGIGRRFSAWMNVDPNGGIGHFLDTYGDPEFNNPSGLYSVVGDIGLAGGLIYFALFAFIAGLMYRRLMQGWLDAVMLYPLLMMGLFELFRYAYWGTSRAVPWFAMVAVVSWFSRASKTAQRPPLRSLKASSLSQRSV